MATKKTSGIKKSALNTTSKAVREGFAEASASRRAVTKAPTRKTTTTSRGPVQKSTAARSGASVNKYAPLKQAGSRSSSTVQKTSTRKAEPLMQKTSTRKAKPLTSVSGSGRNKRVIK